MEFNYHLQIGAMPSHLWAVRDKLELIFVEASVGIVVVAAHQPVSQKGPNSVYVKNLLSNNSIDEYKAKALGFRFFCGSYKKMYTIAYYFHFGYLFLTNV